MMDALAIEAAEAAVHCGLPAGAGAVLHRRAGRAGGRGGRAVRRRCEELCAQAGAFEIRVAADDAERALFWKGRKSAFAAVGRISPDYIVQDGVIPRTALPEVLRAIADAGREHGRTGGQRLPRRRRQPAPAGALRRRRAGRRPSAAEEVSGAILDLCIEHGGSITGEHGVGVGQGASYMPRMFTDDDLDTHAAGAVRVRPGRACPTPARSSRRRGCAARSPAGTAAPTRWSRPDWRSCSDDRRRRGRSTLLRQRDRRARRAGRRRRRGRRRTGPVRRRARLDRGGGRGAAAAAAEGLAVVVRGGGTKLGLGHSPAPARPGRRHRAGSTGSSSTPPATWSSSSRPASRWPRCGERLAGDRQRLALDAPVPGATVGGMLGTGAAGPAAAAVRRRARPADRRHGGPRRRRGRQGRRQGGQERRRLRPGQAVSPARTGRSG